MQELRFGSLDLGPALGLDLADETALVLERFGLGGVADGVGGRPGLFEPVLDALQVRLIGLPGLLRGRLVPGDPSRPLVEDAQDGLEENTGEHDHEDPDEGEDDQGRGVDFKHQATFRGGKVEETLARTPPNCNCLKGLPHGGTDRRAGGQVPPVRVHILSGRIS
jgi:hypothetical protein